MSQKMIIVMILLIALFLTSSSLVFAQHEHQGDAAGQPENEAHTNGMMGHEMMMGDGMMNMMNMMMARRAMMDRQVAPTADGGVVILIGDQLYKYDENLDLVNEVEIPVDYERMKERMQGMPLPDNDSTAEDHDHH